MSGNLRCRARGWLAATCAVLVPFVLLACGGGADGGGGARRQVLVVLLDGLRADRLSCYGYGRETTPAIDALAREGTVFRATYSQATNTRSAVPCLLYSRYFTPAAFPFGDELPLVRPRELFQTFDRESLSLPRAFAAAGFVTAGMSTHNWTKATTRLASEFAEWHDLYEILPHGESRPFPEAEAAVDYALGWIEDYRERDFFLWLHLVDTTFPHAFGADAAAFLGREPPDLARFDAGGTVLDPSAPLSPDEQAWLDALYDGGLRATDRALGRLFAELEGSALLEHGVVAVVSDHGQGLMESSVAFGEGGRWYEPQARVPMILAGGRTPRATIEGPVELLDLYPTLTALMDVELPAHVRTDGVARTPEMNGEPSVRARAASDGALVLDGWKAYFNGGGARILGEQRESSPLRVSGMLVDLEADPGETRNLRSADPQRWVRMVEHYRAELGPAYERYLASTTTRPPSDPFAVGVFSFEFDREVPRGPRDLRGSVQPRRDPEGWTTSPKWPRFYLLGHGQPEPLALGFPVPDGTYELELAMTGACLVQLPGESRPRRGRARAFYPRRPNGSVQVPIGAFEVRGGRFEASFEVDPESPYFYLRAIGFKAAEPGSSGEGVAHDPRAEEHE